MTAFPEFESEGRGWSRRRGWFLGLSTASLLIGLFLVREVLLPFLLALIIAYVLYPVVAWVERRARFPRSLAIVSVYVVLLGTLYLGISMLAPRLFTEATNLGREIPSMIRKGASDHGPAVEAWLESRFGEAAGEGADAPKPPTETEPALVVQPLPDGSYAVRVSRGVALIDDGRGTFRLQANEKPAHKPFHVNQVLAQGAESLRHYVEVNSLEIIRFGQQMIAGFARSIFLLFMVLMVAGYLMHTRESILGFFRSLIPTEQRPSWNHLLMRVDRGLSGVVRGQLLICVVNGVLSAIGFWLFDLKYWPILSLMAMALSIIPIFGAVLSSVPAVLVGLTQGLWTGVWVLVWILGIHQVEANLLNPKIIGVSAKIHPVLVVFSLLVGEHYFGLWGALFAVPILSVTQSIFNHFRFLSLDDTGPDSLGVRDLLSGAVPRRSDEPV